MRQEAAVDTSTPHTTCTNTHASTSTHTLHINTHASTSTHTLPHQHTRFHISTHASTSTHTLPHQHTRSTSAHAPLDLVSNLQQAKHRPKIVLPCDIHLLSTIRPDIKSLTERVHPPISGVPPTPPLYPPTSCVSSPRKCPRPCGMNTAPRRAAIMSSTDLRGGGERLRCWRGRVGWVATGHEEIELPRAFACE